MTIYRIKSATLKGQKVESIDRKRMETRLSEVLKKDPKAKLLTIPGAR